MGECFSVVWASLVSGASSLWGSMGFDGEGSKKIMEWEGDPGT